MFYGHISARDGSITIHGEMYYPWRDVIIAIHSEMLSMAKCYYHYPLVQIICSTQNYLEWSTAPHAHLANNKQFFLACMMVNIQCMIYLVLQCYRLHWICISLTFLAVWVSIIYIFKVHVCVQYKLFHLPFVSFLRFIHIDIRGIMVPNDCVIFYVEVDLL